MLFDVEQSQRIWFLLNSAISCSSQFLVTLNSNKNASHVYRVATTNPISWILVECKLFFAPTDTLSSIIIKLVLWSQVSFTRFY